MTKKFANLLALVSCALNRKSEIDVSDYCFEEIYSLAKSQQLQTIIFPIIKDLKENKKISINEDFYKAWEGGFLKSVLFSFQRNQYVSELIKKLDAKEIKSCILKGLSLSELYPVPDSRVSSDVDLLIPNKDHIKTVLNMLSDDGFRIGKIIEGSHQIECYHPKLGLIEIHTDICDEIAKNVWFENSIELSNEFVKKDDGIQLYYSLQITDGAIYVTFHFLKHFLSHGCGVRQMLDMLLYLKRYENYIDWDKYNSTFSNLNYLKFIERCKDIGNRYFEMDFNVQNSDEELCESVLTDMENGGIFGYNEEYRKTFTYYYTKMRSTKLSHSHSRAKNFIERCVNFLKEKNYNIISIIKALSEKRKRDIDCAPEINQRIDFFEKLGFFEK